MSLSVCLSVVYLIPCHSLSMCLSVRDSPLSFIAVLRIVGGHGGSIVHPG
jgi:hypothetical protein